MKHANDNDSVRGLGDDRGYQHLEPFEQPCWPDGDQTSVAAQPLSSQGPQSPHPRHPGLPVLLEGRKEAGQQ